jgi:hypothetical protein
MRETNAQDRIMFATDCHGQRVVPAESKELIAILSPPNNKLSNSIGRIVNVYDDVQAAQRANKKKRGQIVNLNRQMQPGDSVFAIDISNPKREAHHDEITGKYFQKLWGQK